MVYEDDDRRKPLDLIFEDQTRAFKSGSDRFDTKGLRILMPEVDYDVNARRNRRNGSRP